MHDTDLALWKRSLREGKRVHFAGAVLLFAAFTCYIAGWTTSANVLVAAGFFLELIGWAVLAVHSDRNSNAPCGDL
jgi:hypothetical protein